MAAAPPPADKNINEAPAYFPDHSGSRTMLTAHAQKTWRRAALAGLALAVLVVLATFQDYGITWDAPYHMANGKHVLAYYATLFEDRTVLTYHNLYLYGGAFDGLVALANLVSPLGEYETSHLLNALVGLIGVIGCWKLANTLGGVRAAFLAALFLMVTPAWYGHMFNNPKDIPFAAAMTWSLYYMARLGESLPNPSRGLVAKLGIVLGLTLGIRVGGVIAFFYLGIVVAAHLIARWRTEPLQETALVAWRIGLHALLPAAAIAYVVMLLGWPWAQQDPINNPLAALRLFSHIKWDIDVLFEGRLVNSMHLPADYLPVYFAVTLPEVVLALLLLGIPIAIGAVLMRRAAKGAAVQPGRTLLFVAIAFPFAYFILLRPVTYDGIRHFLFVLPPIAVAAGLVADYLLDRARAGTPRHVVAGVFAAAIAWQIGTMVRLHPDEYVYYNELVGGVDGAEENFELDYWGNSYAEAVTELADYLRRETPGGPKQVYRVAVCSSGTSASYFFPPFLTMAKDEYDADFYIAVTRLGCDAEMEGNEIIRIERDGATLSVVKDRRRLKIEHPERLRLAGPPTVRVHPGAINDPTSTVR